MTKYAVAKTVDFADTDTKLVEVNGSTIGIYKVRGQFYAYRNICPHAGAPVCQGPIRGTNLPSNVYEYKYGREQEILRCPWHGWEFDLTTGYHLVDPRVKLRPIPVEQDGEDIYLIMK